MKITNNDIELAKQIREFEFRILQDYKKGIVKGSIHLYIGQEINASYVCNRLDPSVDIICSNHRGHGHFLAFTKDKQSLYEQIKNGHSQELRYNNFYSTGIQAGLAPVAVGMAYAKKIRNQKGAVVVFIGDGTFGQGVLYESLHLSKYFDVPIMFVVENNHYAMSTPTDYDFVKIFEGFGLNKISLEKQSWRDSLPGFLIFDTWRFCGHSASDTLQKYKSRELEKKYYENDILGGYMLESLSQKH